MALLADFFGCKGLLHCALWNFQWTALVHLHADAIRKEVQKLTEETSASDPVVWMKACLARLLYADRTYQDRPNQEGQHPQWLLDKQSEYRSLHSSEPEKWLDLFRHAIHPEDPIFRPYTEKPRFKDVIEPPKKGAL